jgi:hypothetical protein
MLNIRIVVTGDNGDKIGQPEGIVHNDVTELVDIPSGPTEIRYNR